jgi:hypothetical protein
MKPEKRNSEDKLERVNEYDRDELIEEIIKAKEVTLPLFRVFRDWTRS